MTPEQIFQYAVLILSPVLSFIGVLLGLRADKRIKDAIGDKKEAEARQIDVSATDKLVDTAMQFVEPLKKELDEERKKRIELETKVNSMSNEMSEMRWANAQLMAGVTRLVYQIQSLGHKPVFDPAVDMEKPKGVRHE